MKDNTFQRRREIEYMLLSGKKLTTTELTLVPENLWFYIIPPYGG